MTTRKGRPTASDARRKLADVLAAAREEFSGRGYRATTIRSVSEKAGVSTRTVYNHYPDKLSLFAACLDFGGVEFPQIRAIAGENVASTLHDYAVGLVEMLTTNLSLSISMLIYREGAEFPELGAAAEANQDRYLIQPLAAYLRDTGLAAEDDVIARARLFSVMALSEWQRSALFGHDMPSGDAIQRHAALVVEIFVNGALSPNSAAQKPI